MDKLSHTKVAYYQGQVSALRTLGFSEGQIKLALEEQGLEKEAIWGAIGRGLAFAGKHLGKALSGIAGRAAKGGAKAMMGPVKPTSFMGMGQRAAGALQGAGKGLQTAPGKTLWGGTKNFFRGSMFSPHARGVGGALGKGLGVYSVGSMLMGPGQSPQPRPMQGPPGYGQY